MTTDIDDASAGRGAEAAGLAALWATFTAKAELAGARVERAGSPADAARRLAGAGAGLAHTQTLAARFPSVADGAGAPVVRGAAAPQVAAAAAFAVAETGSLAVGESNADRGACFLADRLWLLVPAEQIVPTLDEALERLAALVAEGTHHALLMTGPSRSADIERTLTIGVHGPRELVVVVVGEGTA